MLRVLVLAITLLVSGCTPLQESGTKVRHRDRQPGQIIHRGVIDVIKEERLQYIIHAGRIQSFEKEKLTLLDSGVVVDGYNEVGQHSFVLTSDHARVEENKSIFQAEGNVIVRTDSGDVLRTERLYWDEARHKIRSDTLVTWISEFDSLCGTEFESDENLKSMVIRQPTGQTLRKLNP